MSLILDGADRVCDLEFDEFRQCLRGAGIGLQIGPFACWLQVQATRAEEPLYALYADYPLLAADNVFNLHVELREVRHMFRQDKVRFSVDGRVPHEDMPSGQALAVLEWGINLVIAMRAQSYLMLHAAAVEKAGKVFLLPAEPGAGKSTLCAGLMHRGWRLFSDEFGLVRTATGEFLPVPRPVALKNESIDVLRKFASGAYIGPEIPNTRKGTVAHVRAPSDAVRNQQISAAVAGVVFPTWMSGAPLSIETMPKAEGFMRIASNAFNYELLGESAFENVREIVQGAQCHSLVYSDLEEAVAGLDELQDRASAI